MNPSDGATGSEHDGGERLFDGSAAASAANRARSSYAIVRKPATLPSRCVHHGELFFDDVRFRIEFNATHDVIVARTPVSAKLTRRK